METLKTIAVRKSTRVYAEQQITEQELETIVHAGCLAPIGKAMYENVHLTIIQNKEFIDEMAKAYSEKLGNPRHEPFYDAPTIVIVSCRKTSTENIEYANAACMIQNMLLAATDIGLGSVYLWGFLFIFEQKKELLKKLNLPEGFTPTSAVCLGYSTVPLPKEKIMKHTVSVNTIK